MTDRAEELLAAVFLAVIALALALSFRIGTRDTGMTAGQQIYEAVFETSDWGPES